MYDYDNPLADENMVPKVILYKLVVDAQLALSRLPDSQEVVSKQHLYLNSNKIQTMPVIRDIYSMSTISQPLAGWLDYFGEKCYNEPTHQHV